MDLRTASRRCCRSALGITRPDRRAKRGLPRPCSYLIQQRHNSIAEHSKFLNKALRVFAPPPDYSHMQTPPWEAS